MSQSGSPAVHQNWMRRLSRIHFVGIGGAGMSGIAELLHNLGYTISGSDLRESAVTARLAALGIQIFIGHQAANVDGSEVIVVSTAVDDSNPELQRARELRIPVVPRAGMLAEIMRFRQGVAVAGTHGKTTTTSLVASVLAEGGLDPTFVIGGCLNSAGSNARLGSGEYLIAEADESDASFLHLQPMVAVVTNIDADHMDTYGGDFARLRHAFVDFLEQLPFYGLAVLCIDDEEVRAMAAELPRPVLSYGFHADADVHAYDFIQDGLESHFRVRRANNATDLDVTLNMPGRHNAQNALAAIAVATELGVSDTQIDTALRTFQGIKRRFQRYGDFQTPNGTVTFVDDYAHHPREMEATLHAVRESWPGRRLVLAFQPHRFSRTRDTFEDLSRVLASVDILLLLDVYPAGEQPIPGADGRSLSRSVRARGTVDPIFLEAIVDLQPTLTRVLQDQDILLTMGAGNVGNVAAGLATSNLGFAEQHGGAA